ncbi:Cytochrome c3 [Aeromonas encheleia]|uniref:cytochrome c3 family protein n=1 Tax=Aeromonas TaxID=642 RepID=UPI0009FF39A9|nr:MULTISPECIES: cytochrome c3 family protein [Aeromonas]MBV7438373.1 cytochrome c3 family protein [Aeromonas sp. sif2416]MBV7598914.1 cytochrome c3 family protein [Aeromonas sp. sia0103]VEG97114.1 Cytochrome c3 [Aeromonas encheleia]
MRPLFLTLMALAGLWFGGGALAEPPVTAMTPVSPAASHSLKPHHGKLGFTCENCHQGKDPKQYQRLKTEDCLACHGSAQKVANRTRFMDANHTNPHNSLHDKLDLDCYECHAEHKPSQNLCQTCHDNTRDWFGPTP